MNSFIKILLYYLFSNLAKIEIITKIKFDQQLNNNYKKISFIIIYLKYDII